MDLSLVSTAALYQELAERCDAIVLVMYTPLQDGEFSLGIKYQGNAIECLGSLIRAQHLIHASMAATWRHDVENE